MGYDHGGSFAFDFEPNGIPFGSKPKVKLSPRSYPIQCKRKWKSSFLSVRETRETIYLKKEAISYRNRYIYGDYLTIYLKKEAMPYDKEYIYRDYLNI